MTDTTPLETGAPTPVRLSTSTPLYDATAADLDWSLVDLDPPFDLDHFVRRSYSLADARADAR